MGMGMGVEPWPSARRLRVEIAKQNRGRKPITSCPRGAGPWIRRPIIGEPMRNMQAWHGGSYDNFTIADRRAHLRLSALWPLSMKYCRNLSLPIHSTAKKHAAPIRKATRHPAAPPTTHGQTGILRDSLMREFYSGTQYSTPAVWSRHEMEEWQLPIRAAASGWRAALWC